MAEDDPSEESQETKQERKRVPLPAGNGRGVLRRPRCPWGLRWSFCVTGALSCRGDWTVSAEIAAGLAAVLILQKIVALWRSVRVKDDNESEYAKTLRWLLGSGILLPASLTDLGLSYFHAVQF
ncbi:MAG TPA: hypothetical protein VME86_00845 [Acidobacteriaceae bacterium]|nr:hypothetical protein [Acidobacteriaceae bacterium]